jgi:hypothetical protein
MRIDLKLSWNLDSWQSQSLSYSISQSFSRNCYGTSFLPCNERFCNVAAHMHTSRYFSQQSDLHAEISSSYYGSNEYRLNYQICTYPTYVESALNIMKEPIRRSRLDSILCPSRYLKPKITCCPQNKALHTPMRQSHFSLSFSSIALQEHPSINFPIPQLPTDNSHQYNRRKNGIRQTLRPKSSKGHHFTYFKRLERVLRGLHPWP